MIATTEEVIARFRSIHGDEYDYSKFEYVNPTSPIIIICRTHGEFMVQPATHWKARSGSRGGCNRCRPPIKQSNRPRPRSTEELIIRLKENYPSHFTYEKTIFSNVEGKVTVTCSKHGDFNGYVSNLIKTTSRGCIKCIGEIKKNKYGETVIERFREVHGDRYDYSKFEYNGMLLISTITCRQHGDFEMTPGNHVTNHGCSKCTNNAPSRQESQWIDALAERIGIKPVRAMRLKGTYGAYDAVFENVVVEFDGAYWHSLDGAFRKDARKTMIAKDAGYEVVRIRAKDPRHTTLPDVPLAVNVHTPQNVNDIGLNKLAEEVLKLLAPPSPSPLPAIL